MKKVLVLTAVLALSMTSALANDIYFARSKKDAKEQITLWNINTGCNVGMSASMRPLNEPNAKSQRGCWVMKNDKFVTIYWQGEYSSHPQVYPLSRFVLEQD